MATAIPTFSSRNRRTSTTLTASTCRTGSYPLSRPYTLTQALAVAGGVTEALADYSSVAIFRRENSLEAERLSVNLKDILAGQSMDPQIKADDVIVSADEHGQIYPRAFHRHHRPARLPIPY